MTAGFASFMLAIGVMAWVYSKVRQHTGGNTKTDLTTSVFVGVIAGVIFFTVLHFLLGMG